MALLGVAAPAAAGTSLTSPSIPPMQHQVRWVTSHSAQSMPLLRKALAVWARQKGLSVVVSNVPEPRLNAKLLELFSSGTFPDLHAWDSELLVPATAAGALVSLADYVSAIPRVPGNEALSVVHVAKGALAEWSIKGRLYGLPYAFDPTVLFYNTELFDAAGVPHPAHSWEDTAWDWHTFVEDARKLTKYGTTGELLHSGVESLGPVATWPWLFGSDWLDDTGKEPKLTQAANVTCLKEVAALALREPALGQGTFETGRSAMTIAKASLAADILRSVKWNVAATPMASARAVQASTQAFSLGSGSEREQTWALVRCIYEDRARLREWVEADGGGLCVPTDRDEFAGYLTAAGAKLPGVDARVVVDALQYARPVALWRAKNWPKLNSLLLSASQGVISGQRSAADALKSIGPDFMKSFGAPRAE